jgi:two-component system, OmpR family, phosphate regulon response regulator PhoB
LAARRHVLIVDDDPAMSDMYGFGLERYGFEVEVLHDPTRLNETVEAKPPDVLVLDWDMPGLRGDEALERLRMTNAGRRLPVFMLSNFPGTRNGAIDRAFAAGAIAWLEKVNTTPALLATKLAEAVGAPPKSEP